MAKQTHKVRSDGKKIVDQVRFDRSDVPDKGRQTVAEGRIASDKYWRNCHHVARSGGVDAADGAGTLRPREDRASAISRN